METENNNQNGTKKGGVKVVIAISVVVILALVGVILWLVFSKNGEEQDDKRSVVVTEDNIDEVLEKKETDSVQPGYYTVTMNNVWHFKTADTPSYDAHVENIEENTNDVYFDIFPGGDGVDINNPDNAIYKSPIIPRGEKLEDVTLEKPLEAGEHECLMIYHLVDEKQNTVSTLRVAVTLVIEG